MTEPKGTTWTMRLPDMLPMTEEQAIGQVIKEAQARHPGRKIIVHQDGRPPYIVQAESDD